MSKAKKVRDMKAINDAAAKSIAQRFGFDQVVIVGRRQAEPGCDGGESVVGYGVNEAHTNIAIRVADFLKYRIMQWPIEEGRRLEAAIKALAAKPETKDLPIAKLGEIATAVFEAAAKS